MAPAGVVGLAGVVGEAGTGLVVVGGDGLGLDLVVGKVGSVGPVPRVATGLPSMMELQPETNTGLASRAASTSEPHARPRRAFCDNRTRRSRKSLISRKQITQEVTKVTAVWRLSIQSRWLGFTAA